MNPVEYINFFLECFPTDNVDGRLDELVDFDYFVCELQHVGLNLTHINNVFDQPQHHIARILAHRIQFPLFHSELGVRQEITCTIDGCEWSSELMAHIGYNAITGRDGERGRG